LYGRTLVGVYLIGCGPIRQLGRPTFFVRIAVPDPAGPEGAAMSIATLADTLPGVPIAQPRTRWFKAPDAEDDPANPGDFDNWPRAARRLWKILLRQARTLGTKVVLLPVWKLAELCGRGQRWVWKAFRQLLGLGVIRRFWCDGRKEVENRQGHHGEVGRATEIVVDLAGPEPKAKPQAKTKGSDKKPATSTGTGALAAIKAAIAEAAQPADQPEKAPAPVKLDWRKDAEELRAQMAASGDPRPAAPTPPPSPPPRRCKLGIDYEDPKALAVLAEIEEKELARRQREQETAGASQQPAADPAGPEVPAAESGS
jgi:DNA-binding Lrp family transcriptional regulator